jgi:hypothetical protein
MITHYTHLRGLMFFLEMTGIAFENRYEFKISNVGEVCIESLRAGNESWIFEKPREIPAHRLN